MSDVFIIMNKSTLGTEDEQVVVDAVVLASKKILSKKPMMKGILESHMEEAQSFWERDGGDGDVPTDKLFRYLGGMWSGIYSKGSIVSDERARELIKQSGGFPGGMEF